MKTKVFVWFFIPVLLLMTTSAWADTPKEPVYLNDVAPNAGPVNYPPLDDPWDLIFYFNAGIVCADNQLLGCEFAGDMFYITGGNNAGEPNQVYACNSDGTLNFQFAQWGAAGWGWRDLAYDGTYLYGSDSYTVYAFDLAGTAVPSMNINGPENPCRALAYDPVTDSFWTQSFGGPIYNFTRTGAILYTGTSGVTAAYGMAWDNWAPDGPWLWIHDQTGTPATTIHQYDPITHSLTGFSYTVPLIPGSSDQIAGGLAMTDEFDPSLVTMVGVTQGTPDDMLFVLEMYIAADPNAPAAPENYVVEPGAMGALEASLSWNNPTLTVGGDPLTSITSIEVERDGVGIATLSGNPGDPMTYDDTVPAAGMYEYTVYCVNAFGNGIPASMSVWIGLDVPAGVENLWGEGVGMELIAELTWDNPTAGAHGGYWPAGSIDGYTINRYGASAATFDLPGIATSFTDNTIPIQGWYEYGVIVYNASGNGPEVMSSNFYVGPAEFEEIPYDWVEINPNLPGALPGINTGISGDDQNAGPFDLGFPFIWYDGVTHSSIRVCSNGWLSFTSTATTYSNVAIPNASDPNDLVAPYWDDLYPPGGGSIWYYADVANDRFICEFYQIPHISGTTDWFTFETILYPDGTIDYMYQHLDPTMLNSCTVGIENATGTVGAQCTYDGSGPLEPRDLMGIRIYPVSEPPPELTVTLVPVSSPVQIPAAGGEFGFYAFIENHEADPQMVDVWTETMDPTGIMYGPLMGPATITLDPGVAGWYKVQGVPGGAPAGFYNYYANAGSYPDAVWAYDLFLWEKLTTGDGPWIGDWFAYGDPFEEAPTLTPDALPTEFMLNGAYPNPFNASATISFAVPEAAKITINVYDVGGRLVTTLVDGWRAAGLHEVTFDGTVLSSGIYIVRMTSGSFDATGKMVLMK